METLTVVQLLSFNAALFVAVAAPGPAFLLCMQATLRGGLREGVMTGFGLALVAGLWTLAALLGLDALFAYFPWAYAAMKIGGAILILFIAVQVWRGARDPVGASPPISRRRAFLRGALLNLANPKSILFSAGVLIVIFPPGLSGAAMAGITLNHVALEAVVYATLATLLSRDAVRLRYLAAKPTISRVMAVVLGALGLRLLVSP